MKYIALIYMDPNTRTPSDSPEFGKMMSGYATATTVRVRNGRTETMDGPFADTKEQLGGFYILDCDNLDDAIKYAAMIPHAAMGCVEVRPIMVFDR